jgi:hypothetical protein
MPEVWDEEKTQFARELFLRADSWEPDCLFDVPPMTGAPGERLDKTKVVWCPGPEKRFLYANHVLPEGSPLKIGLGARRGRVFFDGPVTMPVLSEQVRGSAKPMVWMSHTPMEVFTQRAAVRRARGRVVVGGLGLGWLLSRVAAKKSVTEVVVVEKEPALDCWLRPRLLEKYPAVREKVGFVVDDVYSFMARDGARRGETTYLLDIWPSFNDPDPEFDRWKERLGPKLWGWGQS